MSEIGKWKNPNSITSTEEWLDYEKDRIIPIKQNFVKRKKQLMTFTNTSLNTFEEMLVFNNLYYEKEKTFFTEDGDLFYADFFIPELHLTVEIDGGYHDSEKRQYLDARKELLIASRGIPTIRLTNEEVFTVDLNLRDFLLKGAKAFWKRNKEIITNYEENFYKWRHFSSSVLECGSAINHLKNRFSVKLRNHYINRPVEEFNRNGDILWTFDNIFECHFKTGLKFKIVLDKFNNIESKRWVTRYRYVGEDKDYTVFHIENAIKLKPSDTLKDHIFPDDIIEWGECKVICDLYDKNKRRKK